MKRHLYQLSYSQDAIKAIVATPSDREAAARKLIEALGGKLHHLFFAFGEHDVICRCCQTKANSSPQGQ